MNNSKETLWGELENNSDDTWEDHSISSVDWDKLLTPQLYPPVNASLHQPSPQLTSSFQILSGESCQSDVTVQNTIRLLQHTRHVSSLINVAQNALSSSTSDSPTVLQPCPPMPTEIAASKTPLGHQPLNFLPPQTSSFTKGREGGFNLEIEQNTARKMLKQSVALVCAHTGFTDTTDSVLRLLTDLMHDFLSKVTKMYRVNIDNAKLNANYCGFHDVLEQTFQTAGIGGLLDLQKMYRERVLNYHNNVKLNAIQLTNHYNLLLKQFLQQNTTQIVLQPSVRRESSSSSSDLWQSGGNPPNKANTPFSTNVIPTAGGGSINITIGGLPGVSYPNMSGDGTNRVTVRSNSTNIRQTSVGNIVRSASNPENFSLNHSDADHRTQASPLSAHFNINPR